MGEDRVFNPGLPSRVLERAQEGRNERLEGNAEYQRRHYQMTHDEKVRDAKERVTKNIYDHMKQTQGEGRASYAEAEKRAESIARRFEREVEK